MNDPIVQEVRKYRMEHTLKFKGDLTAICADLRSIQATSGHIVVRLPPRRLVPIGSPGTDPLGQPRVPHH